MAAFGSVPCLFKALLLAAKGCHLQLVSGGFYSVLGCALWNADKRRGPKRTSAASHRGCRERAGPWQDGGRGACPGPASPPSLVSEHCCWCCPSHVCLGTSSALGRGAVINHPIRREPFPSAPLCQHILLCCLFFLVESSSYKWYLCNLARMF